MRSGSGRPSSASATAPPEVVAAPGGIRLETVLRHASDAVVLCDADGRVLDGNDAADDALGARCRSPEVVGVPLADLLPEEVRGELTAAYERLRAGEEITTVVVASAGAVVRLHVGGVLHHDRLEGMVVVWRPGANGRLRPASRALGPAEELRRGVAEQQLRLHYQPIVELVGARPVATEALVRWQHPHRGLIGPGQFIGLAERAGLVVDLGAWVLREACRTAAAWLADTEPPLRVTVNLSAHQLRGDGLVTSLRQAMAETGCPAESLVLEVTETAVMADLAAAVRTLAELKELGVGLAIDDFGTGYSSLLYLKKFPVDSIKIDRTFVAGLGRDPDDTAIVAATVALAHSVDVRCVAEGVETVEHLDLLRGMGCDFAQGYLFSQPLDLASLREWFEVHLPAERPTVGAVAIGTLPAAVRDLLREGASLHTIAAALNGQGSRTARGTRWSARTVARLIAHLDSGD
ncbi:MAG TPA: EAL domain-containing protein [Mycobacteriales bacterium]|nr:EAL domain-containing protein [Mycobacteriales bacterium]